MCVRSAGRATRLLVATRDGLLLVFALDAAEGGDCALLRTHRLLPPPAPAPRAPDGERPPSPAAPGP